MLFETSTGTVVTVNIAFDNSTALVKQNVCTVFGSAIASRGSPGNRRGVRDRRFLIPGQVAARYGASPAVRARFVRTIRRYGFSVRIDPSGVFARVTGPVTLFERVFKVRVAQGMGDDPPGLV